MPIIHGFRLRMKAKNQRDCQKIIVRYYQNTMGEFRMKKIIAAAALCVLLTACADTSQISQQASADNTNIQSQLDKIEMQNEVIMTGSAIILGVLLALSGI